MRIATIRTSTAIHPNMIKAAGAGGSGVPSLDQPRTTAPRSTQAIASKVALNIRQFLMGDASDAISPIQMNVRAANVIALTALHP